MSACRTYRCFGREAARVLWLVSPLVVFACSIYDSELVGDNALSGGAGSVGSGPASGGTSGAGPQGSGGSAASGVGSGTGSAGSGGNLTAGSAGQAMGGAAVGGASGSSGSGTGVGIEFELIDDMEDGNAFVRAIAKRDGHWDVGHDETPGGTQTPQTAKFTMLALPDEPHEKDRFVAYTKGQGFEQWGAFMTVSMRTWPDYMNTPPYDASAYTGLSFFAKVSESSDHVVRVRFIAANTDPRGGECVPTGTVDEVCYDHFFAEVELKDTWDEYRLNFVDFTQAGVGKQVDAIDLARMYAIEFFFPSRPGGNAFELWVDDIQFMKNK